MSLSFGSLTILTRPNSLPQLSRWYSFSASSHASPSKTIVSSHLKNVSFQMSPDWYQIFKIGNYNGLLVHGDEIKSFGGNTPAFGILRKVSAWSSGVIEPFHDCYMGHWHTPMSLTMSNGGRIFVTGSPESHNEYAREFVAAVGRPSQRLHFIDPEKARVTSEHVLWLD